MISLVFAALAATPTPQEILAKVQATYTHAGDITADFEQSYVDALRGRRRTESGKLWAVRDGRVRWSYLEPTVKDFVFDGEAAYFYEPEFSQVTVIDKFRNTPLATALAFLIGKGDLARLFRAEAPPAGEQGDAPGLTLLLKPVEPIPTVTEVRLVIEPKTYRVRRTTVVDPLGNRTAYELRNLVVGAKVDATKLKFAIPAGVQILRSTATATGG